MGYQAPPWALNRNYRVWGLFFLLIMLAEGSFPFASPGGLTKRAWAPQLKLWLVWDFPGFRDHAPDGSRSSLSPHTPTGPRAEVLPGCNVSETWWYAWDRLSYGAETRYVLDMGISAASQLTQLDCSSSQFQRRALVLLLMGAWK